MPNLTDTLVNRFSELKRRRGNWEHAWQELSELILPRKSNITSKQSPGSQQTRRLYDSTAIHANSVLADAILGGVTSVVSRWFSFSIDGFAGRVRNKVIDKWLEDAAQTMFNAMQQSNFAAEAKEVYLDLGALGTGAMFIDENPPTSLSNEGFRGLHFRSINLSDLYISEDHVGTVTEVLRPVMMKRAEAVAKFDRPNDRLHEKFVEKAAKEPLEPTQVLHAVFLRNHPLGRIADKFPVASVWIDMENEHIIRISGYKSWPIPVARWSTISGEEYGRGPGFTALPDILSLNKADEFGLRAWLRALDPPILARHDSIIGTPDLRPSRFTFVGNPQQDLMPFPQNTRLDIDAIRREDKKNSIRQIFFTDQIQFVPERGKTPATATEITALRDIMLQVMGPELSRLEFELFTPMLSRVFQIMMDRSALPPPPPEVLELAAQSGGQLGVQLIGPIARARLQTQVAAIQSSVGFTANLAASTGQADVMDVIDLDEVARQIVHLEGAPQNIIRSRDLVSQRREQRLAEMQQQQENAALVQGAQAAKDLSAVAR